MKNNLWTQFRTLQYSFKLMLVCLFINCNLTYYSHEGYGSLTVFGILIHNLIEIVTYYTLHESEFMVNSEENAKWP